MNALKQLEERLQREIPAFRWQCKPSRSAAADTGVEIPNEIEISASQSGLEVPGSPFRLSGNLLRRWGVDSTARLICHEFLPGIEPWQHRQVMEWDKLAEI
jgi:hypothetical protein